MLSNQLASRKKNEMGDKKRLRVNHQLMDNDNNHFAGKTTSVNVVMKRAWVLAMVNNVEKSVDVLKKGRE